MAWGWGEIAPKPARRVSPATKKRRERKIVDRVRAFCVDRDGHCRIFRDVGYEFGACDGVSEWCHFGEHKRFKTRGKAPEERHTTAGSFMGCTKHHDMYDQYQLMIVAANEALGANGTLNYRWL